ncbi:MAG TPA: hypothetical protein VJ483_00025 [Holophagaceae bacterium]|nr:hypothetical protein [Holophagaceae bacterium]
MNLTALLTAATGLGYGWLRYFGQVQGDFGPEPHHLQPLLQHLHVLTAPLLLFTLGVIVRGHLWTKLRSGRTEARRTGFLIGLLLAPMVLSGYGVQVATDAGWRTGLAWVHGISSLIFLLAHAAHLFMTWRLRESAEAPEDLPIGTA